jgi:hypothetical protein
MRARRIVWKNNQICNECGTNNRIEGKTRCEYCSTRHNKSSGELTRKYIQEGRCTRCGSPAEENHKMCNLCRLKNNRRLKEIHQKFSARVGDYFGDQCYICKLESTDYEIYECHHLDPSTKESQISLLSAKDWDSIVVPELEKCIYLCKICHARLHVGRFDEDLASGELNLIPGKVGQYPKLKVVGGE